ncbi:cytochrome C [Bordetella sp. H567]|uniref:c-type cytochrome n=1 Tax=Bordetella sp. H567 TaxID=1697043 RepID=UPI00081CE146|nr:cytochrome C [Bordetella sp. H567]
MGVFIFCRAACVAMLLAAASAAQAQVAGPAAAQASGAAALEPGTMRARVAACTACHGEQGRAGPDGYYPRLAGKPRDYLYHQLLNFRDGRRQYPPMAHLLHNLPDTYLREIAAYFSEQHVDYPPPARADVSPAMLERGRLLTTAGDPGRGVPACAACHTASLGGLAPAIPGLLGLPRDYLLAQVGSWRSGTRRAADPDCMAHVARQLAPDDIAAVAAWLSSQPVPPAYQPAAASITLPTACGSQTQE